MRQFNDMRETGYDQMKTLTKLKMVLNHDIFV